LQKHKKLVFLIIGKKIFKANMPDKNETTMPNDNSIGVKVEKEIFLISKRKAPKIIGIDSKKENLAESFFFYQRDNASCNCRARP